jgi:hypothetical protein
MLIGTFRLSIVYWWWTITKMVIFSPLMILKTAFLWFFMSFATSYIFFLVVHKFHMVYVRKDLAVALARSLIMGFFVALMLVALYQFILANFMTSRFFETQQNLISNLDMFSHEFIFLYQKICIFTLLLSGLFATHYVGEMLDAQHEPYISDRYGWTIMAITLLCCGFLWIVNYIF